MAKITPLPFAYDALEPVISERTMTVHHDDLYAGYVRRLNRALDEQPELKSLTLTELLTNHAGNHAIAYNAGGAYNHELLWKCLSPKRQQPGELTRALLEDQWGSVDHFKGEFDDAAAAIEGSGWAWFAVINGKLGILTTSDQENPILYGGYPFYAADVWEHAYLYDYNANRPEYLERLWKRVNWKYVEKRLTAWHTVDTV